MQFWIYDGLWHFVALRQIQEKYLAANKPLFTAFCGPEDKEISFNRIPRDVICWGDTQAGNRQVANDPVHAQEVRSSDRVGDGYSEEFGVELGVHRGPEPWELLYAGDLMFKYQVHGLS